LQGDKFIYPSFIDIYIHGTPAVLSSLLALGLWWWSATASLAYNKAIWMEPGHQK